MNYVLIGNNASGKTLYLRNLLQGTDNLVSNLIDLSSYSMFPVSSDRVALLEDELNLDSLDVENGKISVSGAVKFSTEFLNILYLLCLDADVLVLDEPDRYLDYVDRSFLSIALASVQAFYKDLYISSHDEGILWLPHAEFFVARRLTGTSNVELTHIDKESSYDYFV